jgi:hypothetical protein
MPRKRVIYQSEALFVSATGSNFKYVTGNWDSGQYNVGAATAANRHNASLNTSDFSLVSQTGANNINVTNGFYNAFFTGTLPLEAFNSGLLNLVNQLNRVQSANYSFEVTRQDINQYGQLASIDRIILEQPTVNFDFSYYLNSGENEANLGLSVATGVGIIATAGTPALSGILTAGKDTNNYYILTVGEGKDANIDGKSGGKVIGIGNGFLSSYSMEASVGNIPTVSVNGEGMNMRFYAGTDTQTLPTINPEDGSSVAGTFTIPTPVTGAGYSALRPGDVDLTIAGATGVLASDLKIQSASIQFDLSRDPIQKLGSRFAFTREIQFPVTVTMSVDAIMGDIQAANLADVINNDSAKHNLQIKINKPNSDTEAVSYVLRGAKLDSQDFSSSVGDNKSVTLTWSAQIGGPNDQVGGLFIFANTNT